MAIYYINPHTTTNGNGAFATPWSLGSSSRIGLVSGDEIRILGVALTSLLTATSYTATVSSTFYQMTITAGGGLGADFAAGNIIYIPAYDTFAKIVSSSLNVISLYANGGIWPIPDSTVFGTSITIRKMDTTTYPASSTLSTYYIASAAGINNITISDCWIDATTRVTDGTVKTVFNSTSTGGITAYLDNAVSGGYGYTVNLQNTHIMNSNALTTSSTAIINIQGSASTITLKQIFGTYYAGGGIVMGATTAPIYNTTLTVSDFSNSGYLLNQLNGKTITINITRLYTYAMDATTPSTAFYNAYDLTLNLSYALAGNPTYNAGALLYNSQTTTAPTGTINFNGMIDIIANGSYTYLIYAYLGYMTINFDPVNFIIKFNKRASTQTSIAYGFASSTSINGPTLRVPTITVSGITITVRYYYSTTALLSTTGTTRVGRVPNVIVADLPAPQAGYYFTIPTTGTNVLMTFRDGSDPIEMLSVYGMGHLTTSSAGSFPAVTKDASVYRTSPPSLICSLATRTTALWLTSPSYGAYPTGKCSKSIKIPVTSGVSVTVTGYIRTNIGLYANGDCDVSLIFLGTEVATQAMTTACINAWEGFTLTFTPTLTGEAYLVWDMYFAAGGGAAFWLDDLTIT